MPTGALCETSTSGIVLPVNPSIEIHLRMLDLLPSFDEPRSVWRATLAISAGTNVDNVRTLSTLRPSAGLVLLQDPESVVRELGSSPSVEVLVVGQGDGSPLAGQDDPGPLDVVLDQLVSEDRHPNTCWPRLVWPVGEWCSDKTETVRERWSAPGCHRR
jgi:hypothetical protein